MKTIVILLMLVPALVMAERYALLSVRPVDMLDVARISSMGFEIVHVYDDGSIDCVANEHEYDILLASGLPFVTRIDDLERFYSRRFSGRSMGGYMTWDEIALWLEDLHGDYPDITSSPTSIGDTYQGRPQTVVKISANNSFWDDDPGLPNVWYDGLIHAREPASMRNVRFFMQWLCDNYGGRGYCGLQSTWLLDNREIWCLPCNNVDGYVYNEQQSPGGGGMHRKNMNWSAGGDGVDLNRNWAVGWGGAGSSGSPSSSTYRGTAPLSEPETYNVDAFWQDHIPAQMHSTHTYGNILIYPWGYKDEATTHAEQYDDQGELMSRICSGEIHGPAAVINYYSSGNTRDHSYGLYGTMSWNHETGGDFAGFWPSLEETVKLSRRNLRSYLLTAFMAGCPYDPHFPGTSVIDQLGQVTTPFTLSWTAVDGAVSYALQELSGYQVIVDDDGSGGPFTMNNWSVSTAHYHSPGSSYLSGGTGSMTWDGTVAVPDSGGGRLSFWAYYNVPSGYCQGSFEVSPDGGENWYYLQTFTRNDQVWRLNVHELDEWHGDTLSFRWGSYGSSADLYVDDILLEVWECNDFLSTSLPDTSYTIEVHETGNYSYRVVAMDPDFGPGWPSEPEHVEITGTGIGQGGEETGPGACPMLGQVHPNPAGGIAAITVNAGDGQGTLGLFVYDITGRRIADLSSQITAGGIVQASWNCCSDDGRAVPPGIYYLRLESSDISITRSLVVTASL